MFKKLLIVLSLSIAVIASAGSICTIDPPRPTASTGFYTIGSTVYDPTGEPFIIRGVDRTHYDSPGTNVALLAIKANAVRFDTGDVKRTLAAKVASLTPYTSNGIVPIPSKWETTCKSDLLSLNTVVDKWIAEAPSWMPILNDRGMLNPANEWGSISWANGNSANHYAHIPVYGWRDGWVTNVPRLRTAGYTGIIVIDAPACGQDAEAVVRDGADIIAADPLKNILFDVHLYGMWHLATSTSPTQSWQMDYELAFKHLKASGLPIFIGEFGPGRNIGPSKTMVTPEKVIADAEANGFGWMPWAWDDNDLAACASDDNWFSMTYKCGNYNTDTDLTTFGKTVVPILKATSKLANFPK